MPKNKKNESSSSSDSDSGPEDRNPPASKKTKGDDSKSASSKSRSNNDKQEKSKSNSDKQENSWNLEKLRFVKINEFRGRKMVDIREFYEKNGETLPGKKGISLSITQWKKLLEVADEVNAALED